MTTRNLQFLTNKHKETASGGFTYTQTTQLRRAQNFRGAKFFE